jgi:2-amino-4-hydroxy-6-hydroxymethyldihydropteridine diphosphokinase
VSGVTPVVVALGSNLGDREAAIEAALVRLSDAVRLEQVSPLFETEPLYRADQPGFLNAVAVGTAVSGPLALARRLKEIEASLGRVERERNGPREIDLDLVVFGVLRLESPGLTLPHPRAHERRFVLEPWLAADPDAFLPGHGPVGEVLARAGVLKGEVKTADAAIRV